MATVHGDIIALNNTIGTNIADTIAASMQAFNINHQSPYPTPTPTQQPAAPPSVCPSTPSTTVEQPPPIDTLQSLLEKLDTSQALGKAVFLT